MKNNAISFSKLFMIQISCKENLEKEQAYLASVARYVEMQEIQGELSFSKELPHGWLYILSCGHLEKLL